MTAEGREIAEGLLAFVRMRALQPATPVAAVPESVSPSCSDELPGGVEASGRFRVASLPGASIDYLEKYIITDPAQNEHIRRRTEELASVLAAAEHFHIRSGWQNGHQESFYSQFKLELGDLNRFSHIGELIESVHRQIAYYNTRRIHSSLKMPPVIFKNIQLQKNALHIMALTTKFIYSSETRNSV